MKRSILLLLITVSLFSCQKQEENPSTVFGYAFDKFTQEPILGAEVHLFQSEFTSFFSPDRITFLETTLSDKDGFFEFQFEELDFPFSHFVYVEEHGFFPEQKDAEKNMEILLEPQANIQLHIKNVNPFNENDKITINSTCGGYTFIGNDIDTLISCEGRFDQFSKINYWVTKNEDYMSYRDSFFLFIGEKYTKYNLDY